MRAGRGTTRLPSAGPAIRSRLRHQLRGGTQSIFDLCRVLRTLPCIPAGLFPAHLLPHEPGGHLPEFELQVLGVDTPEQVEQARDQPGPPRLVAGAEPRPVVTLEVFIEEDQIAPVRIVLELGRPPYTGRRPLASRRNVLASRRESSRATSNSVRYRPEPVGHCTVKSSP